MACLSFFSLSSWHAPLKLNDKGNIGFSLRTSQIETISLLFKPWVFCSYLDSASPFYSNYLSIVKSTRSFYLINLKIFMKLSIIRYSFKQRLMIFSKWIKDGLLSFLVNSFIFIWSFSKKYIMFIWFIRALKVFTVFSQCLSIIATPSFSANSLYCSLVAILVIEDIRYFISISL